MNKKGFTLIELVISIVLITVIIVPIFALILNLKNKQIIASDKQELIKIKNLLTKDIEDDVLTLGVKDISLYTKITFTEDFETTIFNDSVNTSTDLYEKVSELTINKGSYYVSYMPIRSNQDYSAIYTEEYILENEIGTWINGEKITIHNSDSFDIDSDVSYKEHVIKIKFNNDTFKYIVVNTKDKTITYDDETYKIDVSNAEIVSNYDMLTYNHQGYIDNNSSTTDLLGQYYQRIRIPINYKDDTTDKKSLGLDYGINIIITK